MKGNVLIDSYGWIEYFVNGPKAPEYEKYIKPANSSNYVTPAVVLFEVYKRIKLAKGEETAIRAIAQIVEYTKIIPISKEISLNGADLSVQFKLPMADALIKAVADEHGATIITGDKHFRNVKNVVFIA